MELWLVLLSAGVCLGPYVVRGRRVSLILSRVRRLLLFGCRLMALFVGRLLYTFPSVMAHNYRCLFTGTVQDPRTEAERSSLARFRPIFVAFIMSANALPATIAALGAAGISYCMLSHLDFFPSSALRGITFSTRSSRLLLHVQGSYPQFRSAKHWRALNQRDTSRRSRNWSVDTAQVTMHSFPTKSTKPRSTRQKRTLGSHPSSCKTMRFV